jgi:glycosyltransferase involved in cell wall biosynthesis
MISIVIPTYNEEENVERLYQSIVEVVRTSPYEIIFIDDGSSDRTYEKLKLLNKKDNNVRIIKFRKNFGQTAAMDAGFKSAKGEIIIPMDADLQNDPKDIPRLVKKLDEGYDVVSGWRKNRKDTFFKKFVSRGADKLRKILLHDKIHDSGCTLKAYRKECFKDVNLYGEMHRFIPAILEWKGFKVTEIVVRHHDRKFGKTKYGFKRTLRGLLDMIVVKFWMQYSVRPMHMFGSLGFLTGLAGGIIMIYLLYVRFVLNWGIGNRPLFLLAILLLVLATQFIVFGLIADILVKIYYKQDTNYSIKEKI